MIIIVIIIMIFTIAGNIIIFDGGYMGIVIIPIIPGVTLVIIGGGGYVDWDFLDSIISRIAFINNIIIIIYKN